MPRKRKSSGAKSDAPMKKSRTVQASIPSLSDTGHRWAVFLRGINVGGSARISMDKLRASVEGVGFSHVKHYLQSGNIIFTASEDANAKNITDSLSSAFHDIGLNAECILLSAEECQSIVARNPLADVADNPSKYLVHMFSEQPTEEQKATILTALQADASGRALFSGRELYIWCPDGISKSPWFKLKFDKILPGNQGTSRNWRTMTKVVELLTD